MSYATSGAVESTGVTGSPSVRFVASSGVTGSSAPFSLGAFEVVPPGDGALTRYSRTPVTISYWTKAVDGASTAAGDGTAAPPMVIHGWLSGTVGGSSPAALSVLFDQGLQPDDPRFYQPRPLPPFPAGSSLGNGNGKPPGFLSLNDGQSLLTLRTAGDGLTPVPAAVELTASVPEPTSLLVFLVSGGALAAWRWRSRGDETGA